MKLIGRRKKNTPLQLGFGALRLVLKGLAVQRVARSAYKGYKWSRRVPFLAAGAAIVAFVARKATRSRAGASEDPGFTAPAPAPSTSMPTAEPEAPIPSTPTPTGSPTAVSPAPTAAPDAAASERDAEPKS